MAARDDVRKLLEQGMKQAEIASALGISPGRVSQLVKEIRSNEQANPPPGQAPKQNGRRPPPPGPHSTGFKKGNPGGPGIPPEKARGNRNALTTGEYSREEEFAEDVAAAPLEPTAILHEQARNTYGRLRFMYRLLRQTEQELMDLAESGDGSALGALAVVEISRINKLTGEGEKAKFEEVELSTKSRSLLDRWIAQHDAITRVELLYGKTAERLKPKGDGPAGAGGIGTLIINNRMPGVDDE